MWSCVCLCRCPICSVSTVQRPAPPVNMYGIALHKKKKEKNVVQSWVQPCQHHGALSSLSFVFSTVQIEWLTKGHSHNGPLFRCPWVPVFVLFFSSASTVYVQCSEFVCLSWISFSHFYEGAFTPRCTSRFWDGNVLSQRVYNIFWVKLRSHSPIMAFLGGSVMISMSLWRKPFLALSTPRHLFFYYFLRGRCPDIKNPKLDRSQGCLLMTQAFWGCSHICIMIWECRVALAGAHHLL